MSKQPRNPVAKALRSPHLAQRRLPARPKLRPEEIDYEEIYARHSKAFEKLAESERHSTEEQDVAYIEAINAEWEE